MEGGDKMSEYLLTWEVLSFSPAIASINDGQYAVGSAVLVVRGTAQEGNHEMVHTLAPVPIL